MSEVSTIVTEGRYVVVQFDQELQGNLEDNINRFQVLAPILYADPKILEPALTPLPITSVEWYNDRRDAIRIELGNNNRETLQAAAGVTYVRYLGGTLKTDVGPLLSFMEGFTPQGVPYKGDQNNIEHIELKDILPSLTIITINRANGYLPIEHVKFNSVSWQYTLTHINEL